MKFFTLSFFTGDAQFYIAQAFGLVALVVAFCSFQATNQKKIVLCQMVSSTFFVVHYFLLGAYVGCLLNALGIARAFVFSQKEHRWANSRAWLAVFAVTFLLAGIYTLDGDLDPTTWNIDFSSLDTYMGLLPIFGMEFTTIAFFADSAAKVRAWSLPSSPFWLIYNFYTASWGGFLAEASVLISIFIGMLRHDRRKEL